jgi:hypothetical protein
VQLNAFVGSTGEVCADMTYMRFSVADGVTAGGWFSALATTNLSFSTAVTVNNTDAVVELGNSNSRVATLPSVANFPSGQKLVIADSSINSGLSNVTIKTASASEKLIGQSHAGAITNSTSIVINLNGFCYVFTPMSTASAWAFWV